MLDIIITHYNEPTEIGMPLLEMIGLQRGIKKTDFTVTIVNDGGSRLDDGCLSSLPYDIRQIDIPHGGISAARNAGIDNTKADWIMFCDFDDTFANVYALRDVITILPADGYDMLWSRLLIEDFYGGKNAIYQSPETQRFVFIHGKVYRTAFLRESGIRFDESLNFQEDSLFNATIVAKTPHTRIGEIRTSSPLYIWVRRENSVTHSGREEEAIWGHFIRNLKVTEENKEHRSYENYCGMVTRTIYDAYFMIHGSEAGADMKRKIISMLVPWITERLDAFANVPDDILDQILEISKLELGEKNKPCRHEDVATWLNLTIKRGV